jgi:release factor glutamine methyltransferase
MTTVEELLSDSTQALTVAGLADARMEAEFLLAAFLKKSRTRLMLDRKESLTSPQLKKIRSDIKKRAQRWPLAYITEDQPFRNLVLKVTPAVLIPRPETEELVEHVLERLNREKRLVTMADIGTGSGCIAISLAQSSWVKHIWAVDPSAKALQLAQQNARKYPEQRKYRWIKGNLLTPLIKARAHIDGLVANLPYVPTKDIKGLEPELFREPVRALDGGADGLDLIYKLIAQAPCVLTPKGWLMLEIGIHQDHAVRNLLQVSGLWQHIKIHSDLSGIARFAEAQLKG